MKFQSVNEHKLARFTECRRIIGNMRISVDNTTLKGFLEWTYFSSHSMVGCNRGFSESLPRQLCERRRLSLSPGDQRGTLFPWLSTKL